MSLVQGIHESYSLHYRLHLLITDVLFHEFLQVAFLGLDPKPLKKMPSYYLLDQQIVDTYKACLQSLPKQLDLMQGEETTKVPEQLDLIQGEETTKVPEQLDLMQGEETTKAPEQLSLIQGEETIKVPEQLDLMQGEETTKAPEQFSLIQGEANIEAPKI